MSRYKPYPKYKDSGIEWLGEVPEGWGISCLKYVSDIYNGNSINDDEKRKYENQDIENSLPYVSTKDINADSKVIDYDNGMRIPWSSSAVFKKAIHESTLVCIEGGSAGKKIGYLEHDVCFVNKLACIKSNSADSKFIFFVINSIIFKHAFELATTGLIPGVSISQLKNFMTLLPTIEEQKCIANFLDRETAKIDELIAKQERMIELLGEKRQALISHTVTKGLDPSVKMKDSGVEWLGEVPEHWNVCQFRRLINKLEQGWSPDASNIPAEPDEIGVIKLSSVKNGKFISSKNKKLALECLREKALFLRNGDFLITRANTPELVGDSCIVEEVCNKNLILCDLVYRLKLDADLLQKFFMYWILSKTGKLQIQMDARGSSMTMAKVSQEHIKSWIVIVPTYKEQQAIADYLDTQTAKIDALIQKAKQAIELLKERRTALISAAVTGKIDVRDAL